jgi:hypothetical protein
MTTTFADRHPYLVITLIAMVIIVTALAAEYGWYNAINQTTLSDWLR